MQYDAWSAELLANSHCTVKSISSVTVRILSRSAHTVELSRHNLSINQIKYLRKVSSKQIGFGCLRDTAKSTSELRPAVFTLVLKIEKGRRKKRDYTFISVINRPPKNLKIIQKSLLCLIRILTFIPFKLTKY